MKSIPFNLKDSPYDTNDAGIKRRDENNSSTNPKKIRDPMKKKTQQIP